MTAIRDAVIRIRTEHQKAKLEAPDASAYQRALEEAAKAAERAAAAERELEKARRESGKREQENAPVEVDHLARIRATSAANRERDATLRGTYDAHQRLKDAVAELAGTERSRVDSLAASQPVLDQVSQAYDEFGIRSTRSLANAGKGAIQLTRAIALMSATGEEDTRKLLDNLIKVEAGVAALKGGSQLFQVAAAFGPIGIAAAAVATAVGVGVVAWKRYTAGLEEAAKAARETRDALRELDTENRRQIDAANKQAAARNRDLSALGIDTALTPEEQLRRIDTEQARIQKNVRTATDEEARLRSALYRRRGYNYGELAPDQQKLIDQFGGFEGVRSGIATQAEQRAEGLRRLIELEQQEAQVKQELINQQKQQSLESLSGAGAFRHPGFQGLQKSEIERQFEARTQQVLTESQAALDGLLRLYRTAKEQADEERRRLESAFN